MRLAVDAANDMVAGRVVETAALVTSLRAFIRDVLDLEAIPGYLSIPSQDPVRVPASGSRSASASKAGGGGGAGGQEGGGGGTVVDLGAHHENAADVAALHPGSPDAPP